MDPASLIVCSGHSAAAEWLLAHDRSSTLIVNVEIASRHLELVESAMKELFVLSEDSTSQSKLRGTSNQLHCCVKIFVSVNVNCQNRSENFFNHDLVKWIFGLHNCWLDEPALAVVTLATSDDLKI